MPADLRRTTPSDRRRRVEIVEDLDQALVDEAHRRAAAIAEEIRVRAEPTTWGEERLSARQLEVVRLIGEGLTNAEIGERLFVSEETVKTHVKGILRRLEARSRSHAVMLAAVRRDAPPVIQALAASLEGGRDG